MPIRPRTAALGAGVCLALLAVVWFAAFHIGFFERADQSTFVQFGDLHGHGGIEWVAHDMVSLINVDHYAIWVAALIVITLLRGRPRSAFAAGVIILGANATTEVLKHVLATPRLGWFVPPASWPSGHSTAAMALALAAVLRAPARLRPAIATAGAGLAVAVGYSVVATGMHYPSDVLGGFLMAAGWGLATVAALLGAERWRPSSVRPAGSAFPLEPPWGHPRRCCSRLRRSGQPRWSPGRTRSRPTSVYTRRSSSARSASRRWASRSPPACCSACAASYFPRKKSRGVSRNWGCEPDS